MFTKKYPEIYFFSFILLNVYIVRYELANISVIGQFAYWCNLNSNKIWPLLIRCTNESKKWKFLRAFKNFKFLQDQRVQIWATPDHTTKEKDERKFIKTFWKQKQNGETNLTILNNKIVIKVSKNNMNEPFHGTAQSFWADLFD